MSAYAWFKLYHDMPDDIKLRRFTPQEKWAWVVLLCLASKSSCRGEIDAQDEDIAEYCEFNCTQDWLYFRDKLIAKGMIEINASGRLTVLHWKSRQYKKPSDEPEAVKERVRRHRQNKKGADQPVTPSNAPVTPVNATVTRQIRLDQDQDQTRSEKDQIRDHSHGSDLLVGADPIASAGGAEGEGQPSGQAVTGAAIAAPIADQASAIAGLSSRYESAAARFERSFQAQLPPWRKSRGPNGWDEEILQAYIERGKSAKGWASCDRADAVAFFVNCEKGSPEDYEKAIAMCEELRKLIERRKKAEPVSTAWAEPLTVEGYEPDPDAARKDLIIRLRAKAKIPSNRQLAIREAIAAGIDLEEIGVTDHVEAT